MYLQVTDIFTNIHMLMLCAHKDAQKPSSQSIVSHQRLRVNPTPFAISSLMCVREADWLFMFIYLRVEEEAISPATLL